MNEAACDLLQKASHSPKNETRNFKGIAPKGESSSKERTRDHGESDPTFQTSSPSIFTPTTRNPAALAQTRAQSYGAGSTARDTSPPSPPGTSSAGQSSDLRRVAAADQVGGYFDE